MGCSQTVAVGVAGTGKSTTVAFGFWVSAKMSWGVDGGGWVFPEVAKSLWSVFTPKPKAVVPRVIFSNVGRCD